LVPEIALTTQASDAVNARFGNIAATIHSGLSGSQRLSVLQKIRKGEIRIVVGPRSAIFAPVLNPGLIIIDEEHDGSYKNNNTPRYHARGVAMHRAKIAGAKVLMGSATPSVEAWQLMSKHQLVRLELTKRLSGGAVPQIKIVSLEKTNGILSIELKNEILNTAAAKRQTILFLNRRGFAYFYKCNTCGFELKCSHCSVSLTYHKSKGKALCHYCGRTENVPRQCPKCGSLDAGFHGVGTEHIEEELEKTFPTLKIARLDADNAAKKNKLRDTLALFKNGLIDVLVGTQMVAKGLNFPNVRLVGIVFADTGLQLPDFRAAERTFSLLVQVAGRAGRYFPDGKVIVQTLRPNDRAIVKAAALDIEGFYNSEIAERQTLNFPPDTRLIRFVLRGKDETRVTLAAAKLAKILEAVLPSDADMLGPSECPLSLIAGNYRHHITIRGKTMGTLHAASRLALERYETEKSVYLEIDVDPVSLL
jgi:primosomal protein N' (replication factor Y)